MKLRLRLEAAGAAPVERTLDGGECVVGRLTSCDVVVPDASVSRRHARLICRDDGWWIETISTRGTFVNGHEVRAPARLRAGDQVALGSSRIGVLGGDDQGTMTSAPLDAERLRILNDVHRALATAIALPELLDLILERCFDVIGPEEGVIMLREPDGSFAVAARRTTTPGQDTVISRRIIDEVAGHGRPTMVFDAADDERFRGSESIVISGIRSVLAVPLADAGGTLGLIALQSRVKVRKFSQDDLAMLESLASAASLRVRNVALAEEAARRQVLEREMSLAHDVQMSMLPRRMPDRPEVEMAASLASARSVGGDLYDFTLDEDRLWFITADVADKGLAAALHTAVVKTLFRATVQAGIDLAEVAARMNRELCRDNEQMTFVTAIVGHLDLATGEAAIVDAGHNPAILVDPAGGLSRPPVPKGVALGVVEDAAYDVARLPLTGGETLLLHTDGATDGLDPAGEVFGEARLDQAIAAAAGGSCADLVKGIVDAVDRFAAGAPPEDDLTLLAVRYRRPAG